MEFWFDYKTFFMSNISIYHICWPYNQICRAVVKKRQIHLHISSWCLSTTIGISCGQLPLILVPWNKVKRIEVKKYENHQQVNFLSHFSPTHEPIRHHSWNGLGSLSTKNIYMGIQSIVQTKDQLIFNQEIGIF